MVQVSQQIDDAEDIITTIDDKPKHVNPSANAAVAGKTCSTGKVGGENLPSHPDVTKSAERQPKGEIDPESDQPCSCPRRVYRGPT